MMLIKITNILNEEILGEFKLYKEYMNDNDKFNFLFNLWVEQITRLYQTNFFAQTNV